MSDYTEHKMESEMGVLLRLGVIVACGIMLLGGILYLLQQGAGHESYAAFHSEPAALRSIGGIWRQVLAGNARGLIQFSALVLIATPVLRVAFAVYGFARQKQWMFVAISLVVLALLAIGLSERG
jgi:uncharacterized membrane protein